MNEKVLITGATGFIGKRVLPKLIEEYGTDKIVALSSRNLENVRTIPSNDYIFDKNYLVNNGCENVEILIHIGAFTPKNSQVANDIQHSNSNISSTSKIIFSKLPNLKKIIFTSSIDVYGSYSGIIDEGTITVPTTLYGWSKLYCEHMLKNFETNSDIMVQLLRIGHVYGEGEEQYKKAIPNMLRNVIAKEPIHIYGSGEDLRTFIYVDDAANAIVSSSKTNNTETINVVGNKTISINELAKSIASLCDYDVEIIHHNSNAIRRDCVFNNEKINKLLSNSYTKFDEGIAKEYEYTKRLYG